MHHQAVDRMGTGLLASAHAPDGVIEALEFPSAPFAVGVQWHAEMLVDADEGTRRLFAEFIAAAAEWGAAKG